jgi:hypothetical protein
MVRRCLLELPADHGSRGRERRSRPVGEALEANRGLAMAPLPSVVIGATLVGAVAFAFLVDFVKGPVFRHLEIV